MQILTTFRHWNMIHGAMMLRALRLCAFSLVLLICISVSAIAQLTLRTGVNLVITTGATFTHTTALTIQAGATLTQVGNGTIYAGSDWTNNNAFIAGTGTVLFYTSATQTIGGTSPTTFYNLTVDKPLATQLAQIDQNVTVANVLSVNQGILRYQNTVARTVITQNDIQIATNGTFDVSTTGTARTHILFVTTNIVNNGSLNLRPSGAYIANTTFTGTTTSSISGTGTTTNFNLITVAKPTQNEFLFVSSSNFTVPAAGFLTLSGGTFYAGGTYTLTNPFFSVAAYSIPSTARFWLDNPNVNVSGLAGTATLAGGGLRISQGNYNVGQTGQQHLLYSTGASLTVEGGNLYLTSAFARNTSDLSTITYTQSGGSVVISTNAQSSLAGRGAFDVGASGSSFTWTAGEIQIQRSTTGGANASGDFVVLATTSTVTSNGVLKIQAAAAAQTIDINCLPAIPELRMMSVNNPIVRLQSNVTVLGNVTIAGSQGLQTNGFDMTVGGNWINNGTNSGQAFTSAGTTSTVTFNGTSPQTISGIITTFNNVSINTTIATFTHSTSTTISRNLRMLSTTNYDLSSYNLTIGANGDIFSDAGTGKNFNASKCILNSLGTSGGYMVKGLTNTLTLPIDIYYPLGTPGVYTPSVFNLLAGGATMAATSSISIRPIPSEHPAVEVTGASLRKYWQVATNGLTLVSATGATVNFYYDQSEVQGTESSYIVLRYHTTTSVYEPYPGATSFVNSVNNLIRSENLTSTLNGEWTAGLPEVAIVTYYSIADGDYDQASSWSKNGYGGVPSLVAPNKISDYVKIGDGKTITLKQSPIAVRKLTVESTGKFIMNTYVVSGDTCVVGTGATVGIAHTQGIASSGAVGNVQTVRRDFNSNAVYIYNSTTANQVTGSGLPNPVASLVINNTGLTGSSTVTISANTSIMDSLVINAGQLVKGNYTIDGNSPGRTFIMRGGEFVIPQTFPSNYTPPTLTAGTINYQSTNNSSDIASNLSTPGILKYNNLTISGSRGSNSVSFSSAGEIVIAGTFNISGTSFGGGNSFLTSGSTMKFIGNSTQLIPCTTASGTTLSYYNLIVSSSGTKQLVDLVTYPINNDFTLEGGTLDANGKAMTIRGNWVNTGGAFIPNGNTVNFDVISGALSTKTIISNGQPFSSINIPATSIGIVQFNDNLSVTGNIVINAGARFVSTGANITLQGNWNCSNSGIFTVSTTGILELTGTQVQVITAGNITVSTFNTLVMNKTGGSVVIASYDPLITTSLEFATTNTAIIDTRTNARFLTLRGTAIRNGSGHVDGQLEVNIGINSGTYLYPIGYGNSYTPALFTFNGSGGTAGLLRLLSDTITTISTHVQSTPGSLGIATANGFVTTASVLRQWRVISVGAFGLGSRTFDLTTTFLPTDIPGGADPSLFEMHRSNSNPATSWLVLSTGTLSATSTQSLANSNMTATRSYVVGVPIGYTFYSITSGNWSNSNTWSVTGYGGAPTTLLPTNTSTVRIGDGKTVILDVPFTVNSPASVFVETYATSNLAGTLLCGTNVINGTGTFSITSGGALGIGDVNGITTAPTASGNIQTTTRTYTVSTTNYIYNGSTNQATGNGLPATVQTFTVSNTGSAGNNIVTMGSNIVVNDSIHIQQGVLNGNTRTFSLGGNWRNTGTFLYSSITSNVTFNGATTATQTITHPDGAGFNILTVNKTLAGSKVLLATGSNITTGTLTLSAGNNAILDGRTNGAYIQVVTGGTVTRTSGHVYGELRKNKVTGTGAGATLTFEIGGATLSEYTPLIMQHIGIGAGETAGYVSANAYGFDHPSVTSSGLNVAKNVQRYWTLSVPTTSSFSLGTRQYQLTATYLNPADIRGGANPYLFDMRLWTGAWTDITTNANTTTTTRGTNLSLFGDFVVGEVGSSGSIFYSRQSGLWGTTASWSNTGYGGVEASSFPSNIADISYIGNNNTIVLDQNRSIGATTVETSGTLMCESYVLSGNQFTLDAGGALGIGHPVGITLLGTNTGNIQTTIVRDFSALNQGKFIYTCTTSAQITGTALPASLRMLEIRSTGQNVVLTNNLTAITDTLLLSGGVLDVATTNRDVTIAGQWLNNSSASAFSAGNRTVTLNGTTTQTIGGAYSTTFANLTMSGGYAQLGQNIGINGALNFSAAGTRYLLLNISDLTLGTSATITNSLAASRYIQTDGTSASGRVIKIYNAGSGPQNITIPIGIGANYNALSLNLTTATFASGAYISVQLRSGIHPNALTGNMLSKYWSITTSGISAASANSLQLTYQAIDVAGGVQAQYIPVRYNAGWEVNLGTSRTAAASPITIVSESALNGDWTAGMPTSFFAGRRFYSIATGNWNSGSSWSNISHSGIASAYYPGERFSQDTVFIATTNTISFNVSPTNAIDSLSIGGTSGAGTLVLVTTANKTLTINRGVVVSANGVISHGIVGAGNITNTWNVYGNLTNNGAVDLWDTDNAKTNLNLLGSGNMTVSGSGTWELANLTLNKSGGLADTLINLSPNFNVAQSTTSNNQYFTLTSGIYRHNNSGIMAFCRDYDGTNTTASLATDDVSMGVNTGLDIQQGTVAFYGVLNTNNNTSLRITGGNLIIGSLDNTAMGNTDAGDNAHIRNEGFRYQTGTTYYQSGGTVSIAGPFGRIDSNPNATIDFTMTGGRLRIMINGLSNSYMSIGPTYGFDFSDAGSVFNWSDGNITVARPTNCACNDVVFNPVSTISGGTFQVGENGNLWGDGQAYPLGLSSSTAFWNVYIESTFDPNSMQGVQLAFSLVNVQNDVIIGTNATLDIYGKSLNVGGNFLNYGNFMPFGPYFGGGGGVVASGSRRLTLNGVGDQILHYSKSIVNPDADGTASDKHQNEPIYELAINKPSGKVILGENSATATNSSIIVRNALIFSTSNTAVIDTRTNSITGNTLSMIVRGDLLTSGTLDQGQINRLGLGHIDGTLRRYVTTVADTLLFPIGGNNASVYTPATLFFSGPGGTAGLLDATMYSMDHPNITNNNINLDLTKNIQRYWSVTTSAASPFALGTRSFSLTLTFLPSDLRGGADPLSFETYIARTPPTPWLSTNTGTRTTTSTQSLTNTILGDYVLDEGAGLPYYSIADGNWTTPSVWSNVGYGGAPASTYPSKTGDVVYIGDGKRITMNLSDTVKAVYVQKVLSGPGKLYCQDKFIGGSIFQLEDSCTIALMHPNGITASSLTGPIRTINRNYGVSHYIFNSNYISQLTGDGIPSTVASITVDNTAPTGFNTVGFQANTNVIDDVTVTTGVLLGNARNVQLNRNLILRSGTSFQHQNATFDFYSSSNATQYIVLDDPRGISFYNLSISKPAGSVIISGASTLANVSIEGTLLFSTSNTATLDSRTNARVVHIVTGATVQRNGTIAHVDGTMRKPVGAGAASVYYEIGDGMTYTPVTLDLENSLGNGTTGTVDALCNSPISPDVFIGNRMSTTAVLNRYWHITQTNGFAIGPRTANPRFEFPSSEIAFSTTNAVIRKYAIPTETPKYRDKRDISFSTTAAWAELKIGNARWTSLGDFYIGEKAQRIFYSIANGLWSTNSSWSFFGFSGAVTPSGEYPNPDWNFPAGDEYEVRDSVIIGGGYTITLDAQPEVAYLEVTTGGTFVIPDGLYVTSSSIGITALKIGNNGTLNSKSTRGIEVGVTTGILRFNDATRLFETGANYIFSGSGTQWFGGGFPPTAATITINTSTNSIRVYDNQNSVNVTSTMAVLSGIFELENQNYLGFPIVQSLDVGTLLTISTGAIFSIATSGTPTTHTLTLGGNVVNNGSWTMRPVTTAATYVAKTIFNSATTQTISGTGTNRLYTVTLDKGMPTTLVDCSTDIGISAVSAADAITYSNGTWQQSAGTLTFDNGISAPKDQTITANGAIHLTGTGSLLLGNGGAGASMILDGGEFLLNTSGMATIGSSSGDNIDYTQTANNRLTIHSGTLNVAGRIARTSTASNRILAYTQNGGIVTAGISGHSSGSQGTFDLGASGSTFTMSGGSIVLQGRTSSVSPSVPDVNIQASTVNVTGGTIQFANAGTVLSQFFDYSVPNGAIWNVYIYSTMADVRPFNGSTNLRIQGDLVNNGVWDATQTRAGTSATSATTTFEGAGNTDQHVVGSGVFSFQNWTMNRGAGTGVVLLHTNASISSVLDLQEGSNSNNQIIQLGTNADLSVINTSALAISDGTGSGAYRYVRTSSTSGRLIRTVDVSQTYLYPVGSFDTGINNYTPATFDAASSGTSGTIAVRVSRGSGVSGGHLRLLPLASDYIQRYWAVSGVTTTIPGQLSFLYLDDAANLTGTEANITRVGRWRPYNESTGGSWVVNSGSSINITSNTFQTSVNYVSTEFGGDWTVADKNAMRRIFFSRQTGNWSDPNSWTSSPTHIGSIYGLTDFPNDILDSTVVGGGISGIANHIINLDQDAMVGGITLGTSQSNTGTLNTGTHTISGNVFTTATLSTLQIGSQDGISSAPNTTGNILSTLRTFSSESNYTYNGTTNQITGSGLPASLAGLTINNSGLTGNNIVTLGTNLLVSSSLSVSLGTFDMQTYISTGGLVSAFSLATNATLRIGGFNNISSLTESSNATQSFGSYFIDATSTVDFYGGATLVVPCDVPYSGASQMIRSAPGGLGYGSILVSGTGVKTVNQSTLVRGDITITGTSTLINNLGNTSLQVLGTIYNNSVLKNDGLIHIGN